MQEKTAGIQCIGFIMDGNRRWAKKSGLPTLEGHKKGAEVFEDTVRFIRDEHIPHAVFYGFSSENWRRSEEEVGGLMKLFESELEKLISKFESDDTEKKVRFQFVGDLSKFSKKLQELMAKTEAESMEYRDTTIWVALSYGGREEILRAVNKAIVRGDEVDEEAFTGLLDTSGMPDPDIIVRTGGAQRLSNFLPWQSVYSELLFVDRFWPDITKEDLEGIMHRYSERTRNFGK